ncbi:MAG: winged helix-turn-helix transcriptional regulator [candidate division Zixibacteria bacterium]|nr:winged helix-turn-helix transcriptional regulator [candidate division Zixibacteria bacterium]
MKIQDNEIYELHAEFCKIIASPRRLMIIELLAKSEMSVSEIAEALDVQHSNVSQHLGVMRSRHMVAARKDGQTVYYRLVNNRLPQICAEIRSILLDGMKDRAKIASGMARRK